MRGRSATMTPEKREGQEGPGSGGGAALAPERRDTGGRVRVTCVHASERVHSIHTCALARVQAKGVLGARHTRSYLT